MNLSLEQIANLFQLEVNSVDEEMACQEVLEGLRIRYESLIKELVCLYVVKFNVFSSLTSRTVFVILSGIFTPRL